MKDTNLKIHIEQLACHIENEMRGELDNDRILNLMDAKEYLRRAWHSVDASPFIANDTQAETCLYEREPWKQRKGAI